MQKIVIEKLDDNYINLFEEGIFIKAFEYSAGLLNELFDYKLVANIDKKIGKIFLEVGFPKNKKEEIIHTLQEQGYSLRIFYRDFSSETVKGNKTLDKDEDILVGKKQSLVIFH